MNFPLVFLLLSFVLLWAAGQIGAYLRRKTKQEEVQREDLTVVLGAALTLLGLIIGFSFSMATSRYDHRKNLEEEEANAIGTEYSRAGMLPATDAAKVRGLLKSYLGQRILHYTTSNPAKIRQIEAATAQLQNELWAAIETPAKADPTPVMQLVVSGMNDVLNSQGYSQAAWWNRIPIAAWVLMMAIGVASSVLFGLNARHPHSLNWRFVILPLIVSVSLFLIADLDSPVGGLIHIQANNLDAVADSLRTQ